MKPTTTNHPAVTQKDIAEYLGVSRPWVARALGGDPKISARSRNKVLEAANKLGYDERANQFARSMAERRHGRRATTQVIGCVGFHPPLGSMPYSTYLMDGIQEAAHAAGREVMLLSSGATTDWSKVDGALVRKTIPEEIENISPLVPLVGLLVPTVKIPIVRTDDYQGMVDATNHLLALGHRRIGYLTDAYMGALKVPLSVIRLAGYRDALAQAGITADERWVGELEHLGDFLERGFVSMMHWVQGNWRELGCTALLVQNDRAAVGAMQALREANIRVPEDVSVIGYDGTEECDLCTPRLTSVEVPLKAVGARAVEFLLDLFEDQDGKESLAKVEDVVLPVRLQIRNSTCPPK